MVQGIECFSRFFTGFEDRYILIGGAACDLWLSNAQFKPRATKDLDIVLIIEAIDELFVRRFWNFIKEGGYKKAEVLAKPRRYYRFSMPKSSGFPFMLELFSRRPNLIDPLPGQRITIIPVAGDISSLSAILLDDEVYTFILEFRRLLSGIPVLSPQALIPLKAEAFTNLRAKKLKGECVDIDNISKHRGDILRLSLLLTSEDRIVLPPLLKHDLLEVIQDIEEDAPDWRIFSKTVGFPGVVDGMGLINLIKSVYGL